MECYIVCVCCVDTLTAKPKTVSQRQFYPTSYSDIIFNCAMSDNNEEGGSNPTLFFESCKYTAHPCSGDTRVGRIHVTFTMYRFFRITFHTKKFDILYIT